MIVIPMKPYVKAAPKLAPSKGTPFRPLWTWSIKPYQPWRAGFPCWAQPILDEGPYVYRNGQLFCAYSGDPIPAYSWTALQNYTLVGYIEKDRFHIYDNLIPRQTFQSRLIDNQQLNHDIGSSPFLLATIHKFDNAHDLDAFLQKTDKPHLIRMHNSYTDDPYGALLYTP